MMGELREWLSWFSNVGQSGRGELVERTEKVEFWFKKQNVQQFKQMRQGQQKNIKIAPFIKQLVTMIEDSSSIGIIEWVTDTSFAIINLNLFSKLVLHKYCKHSNLSSFIRQLNAYGFSKEKTAEQSKIYSNQNFMRNNKNKQKLIKRFQLGHSQKQNTSSGIRYNKESRALALEFIELQKSNQNLRNGNRKTEKEIKFINKEIQQQIQAIKLMCFDLQFDQKQKGLDVVGSLLGEKGKQLILGYIGEAMQDKKIEELPESYSWLLHVLSGSSEVSQTNQNSEISSDVELPQTFSEESEECPSLDFNERVYYSGIQNLMSEIPLDLDDLLY